LARGVCLKQFVRATSVPVHRALNPSSMPQNEDVCYQAVEDGSDSQRSSSARSFKFAGAVIGGTCLALLTIVGIAILAPSVQNTSVAESTNLVGMPNFLRSNSMKGIGQGIVPPSLASIPAGPGPWKELALASLEAASSCDRDVSAKASSRLNSLVASLDKKDRDVVARATNRVQAKAKELKPAPYGMTLGMVGPVEGLWDPFGFSAKVTQGELAFFREAEIKHGRVCMLAVLGFWVQESFHPLFGGNIDVPAIQSVGQTELLLFWPALFVALGIPELAALDRIDYAVPGDGFTPELKPDVTPGDVGFDPLGLFSKYDPEEAEKMQNRELLHGRLAMISAAGAIAQEILTQQKLTEGGIYTYG